MALNQIDNFEVCVILRDTLPAGIGSWSFQKEDFTLSGMVPVEDWAKGKDEYFALVGIKKPREKVASFFATTHTGLSKTIKSASDYLAPSKDAKSAKKFLELKTAFEKAANEYCALLTKLIDSESDKTVKEFTLSATGIDEKKLKTNMYRGLKMLRAKLDAYKAQFDFQYKMLQDLEAKLGISEMMEGQFQTAIQNGFKRYQAAEKTIKATPTIEVYNREMGNGDAVRVLTTTLAGYTVIEKQLAKTGAQPSPTQAQMLVLTKHWITQLSPWANGAKKQLAGGANILAELKAATAQVKACAAAFHVAL